MADLRWTIHEASGRQIAACYYPEDAAALVSLGGTRMVKRAGRVVYLWPHDRDEVDASDSYDGAAELMVRRHHHEVRI